MVYESPIINMCSRTRSILGVRWAPMFEGVPAFQEGVDWKEFYEAYDVFSCMVDPSHELMDPSSLRVDDLPLREWGSRTMWERKLEEGDCIIFNNRRMAHGRNEFEMHDSSAAAGEPSRWLMGCYSNIDDALMRYRVAMRDRDENSESMTSMKGISVGNGSRILPW